MVDRELDVRPLSKPDKHPAVFAAYEALAVGESFVLVNNHDPRHLRGEFDTDHPGSYGWDYLAKGPQEYRIRITKLSSTPLPRVLVDTSNGPTGDADAAGALWHLDMRDRDLDANIVQIPSGGSIGEHTGPANDVLLYVLRGSGRLTTELGEVELAPGALVWLPRASRRQFDADEDGLRYVTVHQRRQILPLGIGRPAPGAS